ncbi:MAG: roadblock/LC7 domain-containing protein [Deltaproteobacteria bacterium]|nr:roadblock/LC7 domain-containing protein [Deltaproteobacteria bacterium]
MSGISMMLNEADCVRMQEAVTDLSDKARVKFAMVLDTAGLILASSGEVEGLDATSLGALTAGNVAATARIAELLGTDEFDAELSDRRDGHVRIHVVGRRAILVVAFDSRSSTSLVRLWTGRACRTLMQVFEGVDQREQGGEPQEKLALGEVSDEDLNGMFPGG